MTEYQASANMDWNTSQLKRGSSRSCIEKIPMLIHIKSYKHLCICTFFTKSISIYQTTLRSYIFIKIYITLNIQKIKPAITTHSILLYTDTSMHIRNIYLWSSLSAYVLVSWWQGLLHTQAWWKSTMTKIKVGN